MDDKCRATAVEVEELTTCGVRDKGETIALGFRDTSGQDVSLQLLFSQAQALTMTLPHLLTHALTVQTSDQNARFVFRLGGWTLEDPHDGQHVIMTLQTDDGFKVSFAVPVEACAGLAQAIARSGSQNELDTSREGDIEPGVPRLN